MSIRHIKVKSIPIANDVEIIREGGKYRMASHFNTEAGCTVLTDGGGGKEPGRTPLRNWEGKVIRGPKVEV